MSHNHGMADRLPFLLPLGNISSLIKSKGDGSRDKTPKAFCISPSKIGAFYKN